MITQKDIATYLQPYSFKSEIFEKVVRNSTPKVKTLSSIASRGILEKISEPDSIIVDVEDLLLNHDIETLMAIVSEFISSRNKTFLSRFFHLFPGFGHSILNQTYGINTSYLKKLSKTEEYDTTEVLFLVGLYWFLEELK